MAQRPHVASDIQDPSASIPPESQAGQSLQGLVPAAGRRGGQHPYLSSVPRSNAERVGTRRRGLPDIWANSLATVSYFLSRERRPDQVRVALPGSAGDLNVITHATAAAPRTRKWAGRASKSVSGRGKLIVHYCGVSLSYAAILGSPKASFWKRNFNILCDVGLRKFPMYMVCVISPRR